MQKPFDDVKAFHNVGGHIVRAKPELPVLDDTDESDEQFMLEDMSEDLLEYASELKHYESEQALRARLMTEELGEILKAFVDDDMEGVADGLADLCYVTIGTALQFGIDLPAVWDAVQEANMAKFPNGEVLRDKQGKIMKPEGWTGPDIAAVLKNQDPIK